MQDIIREVPAWDDYQLLDSGEGEKCEQFGEIVVVRPDPLAIWQKFAPSASHWQDADLVFEHSQQDTGWQDNVQLPHDWNVTYNGMTFLLHPAAFKHVGVFPEQAANWEWLQQRLESKHSVLNLFAYTGGATMAAAKTGASVVHVDASKPSVTWANENAQASGLADANIRWIVDDAIKFCAREARRGNTYDAIIMDPPPFGRGPKGEVWKFEEHTLPLLQMCSDLLKQDHGMLLFNSYALGYPLLSLAQLVAPYIPSQAKIETIELALEERSKRGFFLPAGVTVRAQW